MSLLQILLSPLNPKGCIAAERAGSGREIASDELARGASKYAHSNHAVERTASQPTGSLGDGGVRGGWLAVAHFLR